MTVKQTAPAILNVHESKTRSKNREMNQRRAKTIYKFYIKLIGVEQTVTNVSLIDDDRRHSMVWMTPVARLNTPRHIIKRGKCHITHLFCCVAMILDNDDVGMTIWFDCS